MLLRRLGDERRKPRQDTIGPAVRGSMFRQNVPPRPVRMLLHPTLVVAFDADPDLNPWVGLRLRIPGDTMPSLPAQEEWDIVPCLSPPNLHLNQVNAPCDRTV